MDKWICGLLTLVFGLAGPDCIIAAFSEKDVNSDDLAGEIAGAIFMFFICIARMKCGDNKLI
jgi:hypothetical protein